jgi:hypothetical protein
MSSEEELKCIELSPQQDFEWDESVANQDPAADVSDDVNGLALTLDNKSSYLGISSITAIIRVIVQIAPDAKTWILNGNAQSADPYQECPRAINEALLPDEMLCINAYFTHVHNSNPLVNEALFRSKHLSGPQNDSPWIALLNMVLTISEPRPFRLLPAGQSTHDTRKSGRRPPGDSSGFRNTGRKLSALFEQAEPRQRDYWSSIAYGSRPGIAPRAVSEIGRPQRRCPPSI